MPKKVPYLIVVNWGGMRTAFGVTDFGLLEYPGQLAMSCTQSFAKLMIEYPDREGIRPFLPLPDVQYRLKITDQEAELKAASMMKRQFQGHWKELTDDELQRLGFNELTEELRSAEVFIELDLIEVHASSSHNN